MNSRSKDDPFDLENIKKVKIKDFIVFKGSEDTESNYIIKEVEDSKENNLSILRYIQNLIRIAPDINSEEVVSYLKQQRIFIKRYLKEVNQE